jgi:CRISPR-associated protein Cas2
MIVLVCYDVAATPEGVKRLRHIATACQDYGVRVQYSIFECKLEARHWVEFRHRLLSLFEPSEDSLRFYFLCGADATLTEHHGVRRPVDLTGPLVV